MKKRLFTLLVLFFPVLSTFAQSGEGAIRGIISTSDGQPAANVTIRIERTRWGGISDENGAYVIKNVKPGTWTVKISAVAAVTQQKQVTVTAGQEVQADFTLSANASQLQEVIVSTGAGKKETPSVARLPLKALENPQVYASVSSEIMKQQGITNYDDALRNVPGMSRTWESTGRAGDGASYFALRGFEAQAVMYNGLPGMTSGNLDPSNVEEIQVIKGPSGTLFGGSFYGYGGLINTITKKPYFDFGGEAAYNFGSFGLNRVTLDINAPLSTKEKIALRVNTAYHTENSFQDAGFKKSFFIAPTLLYEVNDRLSFQVVTEILDEERAVPPVFFHSDRYNPLPYKNIQELNLNNNLSFTSNDLTIKNPRYNLQAQMVYKFNEQWSSQTAISRATVKSSGLYTYIWEGEPVPDNWFNQYYHNEAQTTNTTDIQQNFNGDFKIGKLRNRVVLGLDFFSKNIVSNGSGWVSVREVTPQGASRYIDPATEDTTYDVNLSKAYVDNLLAGSNAGMSNVTNNSYSAYFSDVLNITPGLMAMVSLRADYFESKGEKTVKDDGFDQFALSHKFGLVYQPVLEKVSLFANYMNAFINVAPSSVYDDNNNIIGTKSFEPEHANQWEAGVKTSLFSDKLHATVSYYDITVSNRTYPDPANMNNSLQGGKVHSKGLEFDITANPAPGLSLLAGYAYNDIQVQKGNKDDFYNEPGRVPGGQGPQNLANLWATYKFSHGSLKNFGIGFGGNYASEYKVIDNSVVGVFNLPGYTLINGSLFYNGEHVRVSLNVNNIGNEIYYIGYWSVNPQKPRNFNMSFAYKF